MSQQTNHFAVDRRKLIILLLFALVVYAVLSQVSGLHDSLTAMGNATPFDLALAVVCTLLTYVFAALTYRFLSFKPLAYGRTLIVQFAAMCVNRIVPSGAGAVGANFLYLRKQRHSRSQATTVVALNNIFGMLGHGLLLLFASVMFGVVLPQMQHGSRAPIIALMVVLAVLAGGLLRARWRTALISSLKDIAKQLLSYRRRPVSLAGALASSMCLTMANVLTLTLCLHSLGASLPFTSILLAFSAGIGLGAAVPTPGGLGGVEAGIAGSLIAYGVAHDTAIASVLLFRLISYWMPLVFGAFALGYAQRKRYFG